MIGKIPNVLKIAIHMNHARWLFLADFHIPINFHTESQTDRTIITGISQDNIERI
jgi:hypothetical protein